MGKPLRDCFGQSFDFSLQVSICDKRGAQGRACIPAASRNSCVYLRFEQSNGGSVGLLPALR
jgi:hypothetical protein